MATMPAFRQVRHQDPGHAQRHGQQGRNLGHRLDLTAEVADPLVLGEQRPEVSGVCCCADQRLYRELVARPGPAAGHCVRTDQRLVAFTVVRRVVQCAVRIR